MCVKFSKFFSGHFAKKFFLALTNFWTFLMSFSQKNFFANFHLKKIMLSEWYQWKKFSGIFLASVCPKEYKNGKIFDRPFFGPHGSISSTVLPLLLWSYGILTVTNFAINFVLICSRHQSSPIQNSIKL